MRRPGAFLLFLLAVCPSIAGAQSGNATIRGTVQDSSGAVVPGADVSATNLDTGVSRGTTTTSAGLYVLPNLIPGTYDLTVTATGFQPTSLSGIQLVIDQQAGIDLVLQVGAVTEDVSVAAAAPLLQTEEASVGSVIQREQVLNMPLNGRSFTQLLQLVPGTQSAQRNNFFGSNDPLEAGRQRNGMPAFDVNGGNGAWTNFRVDGVENQEREFGGASIPVSVDAIQEVKLQTSNFSAEYGRGPAQVDVVTKAGTNGFQGTLFEFLRDDALDARQWTVTGPHPKLQLERHQFGGNVGGPIKRNKLFFFFNYDGTREEFSSPRTVTVPTEAMRRGEFPSGVLVFDPSTGRPFPNNTIPADRIDPVAQRVVDLVLPAPNQAGIPQTNDAGFDLAPTDNYFYDPKRTFEIDQYITRIDYNHSGTDSFNVRHIYSSNLREGDGPLATNIQGSIVGSERADLGGQNYSGTWYHHFGPTTINELRAGVATNPQKYFKGDTSDWAETLGVKQFLNPNAFPGMPRFDIGSVRLSSGDFRPLQTGEVNYLFVDNLTLVRGEHQFRLGTDIRRTVLDTRNNSISTGQFFFNGAQTRDRRFPTASTTFCPGGSDPLGCASGHAMADFLLGYLSFFRAGDPIPPTRKYFTSWAGYVNDTWRIRNNLTLNFGLRYEYTTRWHADPPFYARPVIEDGAFTGKVAVASSDGEMSQSIRPETLAAFPDTVVLCTDIGLPENCMVSDKNNWQPRLGFAWRLTPKTVVRGAAGIFYGVYFGDLDTEDGANFPYLLPTQTLTYTRPPSGTEPPPLLMSNPRAASVLPTPRVLATEPAHRIPGTYQWNLSVERELLPNTVVTASYVGSLGRHQETAGSGGWFRYNVPEPWGVVLAPGQAQTVPHPQFGEAWVWYSEQNTHYEALQLKLDRRFSEGLALTAHYTWSKNTGKLPKLSDPRSPEIDRGLLDNDVPHIFVLSSIWQLPFGEGRRWVNAPGVLDHLVGGWQVSTILNMQSGYPFTPLLAGTDLLLRPDVQQRPDRVCDGAISNPTLSNWFDKECFTVPVQSTAPGDALRVGNSGFNILRGPGAFQMDLGLSKTFRLKGTSRLEFRAEAFNVLNHPVFSQPNATIRPGGNSPPAQITSVRSLPRIIQVALKFHF